MYEKIVQTIIRKQGGYRERSVMERPHTITQTGTWNDDHKVLEVLERCAGPDGYRAGFAVDIVTMSICG